MAKPKQTKPATQQELAPAERPGKWRPKRAEVHEIIRNALEFIEASGFKSGDPHDDLKRLVANYTPKRRGTSRVVVRVMSGESLIAYSEPLRKSEAGRKAEWWEQRGFTATIFDATPEVMAKVEDWIEQHLRKQAKGKK